MLLSKTSFLKALSQRQCAKQTKLKRKFDFFFSSHNSVFFTTLYPLIFFDLRYQAEQVSRDPKQLMLKYQINTNDGDNFRVHAIVLYEKDVVIDKVGDQLVIV